METRILNNLVVQGSLVMADNLTDFPPNPAIGTFVVKDQCLYGYIKIGGLTTWYPFASKTNSYIHSQGIASTQWIIQHNLGTTNVWTQVKDTQGRIIQALVEPVDENTLRVTFTEAVAGTAVIVAPDSINVPQVEASLIDVGSGKVIIDTSGIRIDGEYVLTSGNIQFYAEQAVADEAAIRAAADTTLQSNIDAEVLARQSGDSALQGQIDAYLDQAVKTTSTPSFSGVSLSGHVIPSANELYDLGSATNRFRDLYLSGSTIYVGDGQLSYDSVLKTFNFVTPTQEAAAVNLSANSTDDLVEGTTNLYYTNARAQAIVDVEATARAAADVTLQSNIDAEATARAGADTTIISSLTAESDARQAADATLQLNIDAVSTAVAALGNAFNYVGVVSGGGELTPTDLATLPVSGKDAGDYYKVSVSGWFKVGTGSSFFANAGDGLVWNTLGDVDKIDNTNSGVSGTTSYISVTGSTDTGFVVDVDSAFKTRVSDAESAIATEIIDRADGDSALQLSINTKVTANAAITAGTATKITYDAKGLVTAGASLVATDIPALDASKIGSGTMAPARLGSGTADGTTFLAGDSTWKTITGGATLSDDVSTNTAYYPTFAIATSGTMTTAKVASTKLTFNPSTGTLAATEFNSTSDERKKTDINTASSSIVNRLRGVEFKWVENDKQSAGVIAQEVETVIPHAVNTDEDGFKSVNYNSLVAYLIEALKDQQKQIDELKTLIANK